MPDPLPTAALANPTNDDSPRQADFEDGIGLCLSGGGYRAMLFHLGTLWRLHQWGLLDKLARISSVSGGSITSAVLALAWDRIHDGAHPDAAFVHNVVDPVRALARITIDKPSIIRGLLLPGSSSDQIVKAYAKHLFGGATLQSLPDAPRFVINATNLQTTTLWRFSKPYMGDWQVGRILNPKLRLATAVAASSAFPPFLSPRTIELDANAFERPDPKATLQRPPFTTKTVLSDGGVYDNLGLETVWKRYRTCLVSDAGMKTGADGDPHTDWVRGSMRVTDLIDSQVRSLRKRQLLGSFVAPEGDLNHRKGAYWSIRGDAADFPAAASNLPCPFGATAKLATVPTRLATLPDDIQERLINWGYAICDRALRSYFDPNLPAADHFPFATGV
jgi:NTE family protein